MTGSKEIRVIPLVELSEHPSNPNRMKKEMFVKLVRHIEKSGNYEPIVVREFDGGYQILNGHHRVKALREIGVETADCVVWDVDDSQALILLGTLNRLTGKDVLGLKSELIKSLSKKIDSTQLAKSLPDTKKTIERLKKLTSVRPRLCEKEMLFLSPMVFFLDPEQTKVVEGVVKEVMAESVEEQNGKSAGANKKAQALVKIVRGYVNE